MAKFEDAMAVCTAAANWWHNRVTQDNPWHGIDQLPMKMESKSIYQGISIPALLSQSPNLSCNLFAGAKKWIDLGYPITKGESALSIVYAGPAASKVEKKEGESDEDAQVRYYKAFRRINTFHASQTSYPIEDPNPVLRNMALAGIDRQLMLMHAKAAETLALEVLHEWENAKVRVEGDKPRSMSEPERAFMVRLAKDLVVGNKTGFMSLVSEVLGPYTELEQSGAKMLTAGKMMRPWGMATSVLVRYVPEIAESLRQAELAAKAASEAYKKAKTQTGLGFFERKSLEIVDEAASENAVVQEMGQTPDSDCDLNF